MRANHLSIQQCPQMHTAPSVLLNGSTIPQHVARSFRFCASNSVTKCPQMHTAPSVLLNGGTIPQHVARSFRFCASNSVTRGSSSSSATPLLQGRCRMRLLQPQESFPSIRPAGNQIHLWGYGNEFAMIWFGLDSHVVRLPDPMVYHGQTTLK